MKLKRYHLPVHHLFRALLFAAYILLIWGVTLLLLGAFGIQLPSRVGIISFLPLFLISVPAIFVSRRLTAPFTEREVRQSGWKLILRGCPDWVPNAMKIGGWLTMLSFLAVIFSPKTSRDAIMLRLVAPIYGMFFSGYSAAIFYSALHVNSEPRFCIKGHEVTLLQKFCPECGSPVSEKQEKQELAT
jgi:hypothetical protein